MHAILLSMNIISLLLGVIVLVFALIGFIPLLGALNWLLIPMALIGAAIGAISSHKSGRNLNLLLVVFCTIRLIIGHGLI
ncbi:hypothetical protein BH10PSE14_BH10PSE14_23090 [soil metagenome]|jgi:hypothetical protein|uniref:hypothetical protein n=1 Tax=Sphingomonas sp. AR_OL41 TaxID=3042729 RepID=UPI00248026E6|nr:hypothetical protein [Sphingomonas sp. AR_OL41]MDH7971419.1 hypothetical protein [Sphingomonas sp. AR_OL41]